MRPLLEGEVLERQRKGEKVSWREAVFGTHMRPMRDEIIGGGRMARTKSWKYIQNIWKNKLIGEELYDLEKDFYEITNLAKKSGFEKDLETFRQMLKEWMKKTDDTFGP